jgi:hypothetical protein
VSNDEIKFFKVKKCSKKNMIKFYREKKKL